MSSRQDQKLRNTSCMTHAGVHQLSSWVRTRTVGSRALSPAYREKSSVLASATAGSKSVSTAAKVANPAGRSLQFRRG